MQLGWVGKEIGSFDILSPRWFIQLLVLVDSRFTDSTPEYKPKVQPLATSTTWDYVTLLYAH